MINYSTYCNTKELSKEEQQELFKEINDCKVKIKEGKEQTKSTQRITELQNKIVSSYIPLVIKAIQRYKLSQSTDAYDLLHEGILGLYYALTKFNYKRNNTFATYAMPWVNLKIKIASKRYHSIDVSPHFLRKFKKFQEEEQKLKKELFGINNQYPVSYLPLQNIVMGNDNKTILLSDTIPDTNIKTPSEMFEENDTNKYIEDVIKTLDNDDQYIIRNRFGFDGDRMTLEEIAKQLNVTRERIHFKEKEILNKLSYRIKV